MIELINEGFFRSFFSNQYKNFVKKFAFKVLKKRSNLPSFWTMPHDTICREILINGFYEKYLLEGMVKLVKENGTVLDIGANIGNHTVFFSSKFKKVISFEPVQSNCWIIKANLYLNSIKNVTLIEMGLSSHMGKMVIAHSDPHNTNNGLITDFMSTDNNVDSVPVVTGDSVMLEMGLDDIVMIKIDVEGHEPQVIEGL